MVPEPLSLELSRSSEPSEVEPRETTTPEPVRASWAVLPTNKRGPLSLFEIFSSWRGFLAFQLNLERLKRRFAEQCWLPSSSVAVQDKRLKRCVHHTFQKLPPHLLARPGDVLLHLLKLVLAAVEDVAVVLAGVQVLQQLRHNLPLWRVVLLPHRAIWQHCEINVFLCLVARTNQFQSVLVEVVDELLRGKKAFHLGHVF